MYIAYVALVTFVVERQDYLFTSLDPLELLMWLANGGYALFEIMEMTFRGIEYFSDSTNYFDMGIMLNWTILFFTRLYVTTSDLEDDLTAREARNTEWTVFYMTIFAIQIIILYCRIATIFTRSKTLGPFIRMIGGMMDDIINFGFITMIFFLGFTFALRYILATDIVPEDIDENCGSEADLSNYYQVTLYVFITLMGQQEWSAFDETDCFSAEREAVATCLLIAFCVLGTVLLFNLLIAMMATTYEDKLDAKSKEVNFSRTEDIYSLGHRPAIIPPPLNILVFGLAVIWYFFELIVFALSCAKYHVNITGMRPVSIDYEQALMDKEKQRQRTGKNQQIKRQAEESEPETDKSNSCCFGIFEKSTGDGNFIFDRKYCQFCRINMAENVGDISNYFNLFRGYRLDEDDVKIIKNIFENRGVCSKCYRPYKLYHDGSSNRLARWQVIIEILSFYVFLLILYWSLLLFLCLPALLVGLWTQIQSLADSNKSVGQQQMSVDANESSRNTSTAQTKNYRTLIRQIIAEETTTEFEGLEKQMDKILDTLDDKDKNDEHEDGLSMRSRKRGGRHSRANSDVTSSQYVDLMTMIADLSDEMKLLRQTVAKSMSIADNNNNDDENNNNEYGDGYEEVHRRKKRSSRKKRRSKNSKRGSQLMLIDNE